MKRTDFKIALSLSSICFIAGFFLVPYQLGELQKTMPPNEYEELVKTIPFPMSMLLLLTSLQFFIISFVLGFLGIKLARKTGFKLHIFDALFDQEKRIHMHKSVVLLSVLLGAITGFIISGADRLYYQYQIPLLSDMKPEFSVIGLLAAVLYGGVFEEILLRLFFMSLLVWIFRKFFSRKTEGLSSGYYWFAIMIASLLFAAGHLPATELIFGELTTPLIIRCFLLNGIGGLVFGYLYWKKGFEYAILAHMFVHISVQLIFSPLFY